MAVTVETPSTKCTVLYAHCSLCCCEQEESNYRRQADTDTGTRPINRNPWLASG